MRLVWQFPAGRRLRWGAPGFAAIGLIRQPATQAYYIGGGGRHRRVRMGAGYTAITRAHASSTLISIKTLYIYVYIIYFPYHIRLGSAKYGLIILLYLYVINRIAIVLVFFSLEWGLHTYI